MADIYYELTKQRTSQSLRMKGARKAYDYLLSFLEGHTDNLTLGRVSIEYFVWTESQNSTKVALETEARLINDFGAFDKDYDAQRAADAKVHMPQYYRQFGSIEPAIPATEVMDYLDRLGPLRELHPRPPIDALIRATFYIPGARDFYPGTDEHMMSRMLAWLSPNSNAVTYSLHFPYENLSSEFEHAKQKFESGCGVKLEDKYFYIRTKKPNGKYTFKKLYR